MKRQHLKDILFQPSESSSIQELDIIRVLN